MRRRCFSPAGMLIAGAILCLVASTAPAPALSAGRTTFSVSSFGAAGNGIADDSEVNRATGKALCMDTGIHDLDQFLTRIFLICRNIFNEI